MGSRNGKNGTFCEIKSTLCITTLDKSVTKWNMTLRAYVNNTTQAGWFSHNLVLLRVFELRVVLIFSLVKEKKRNQDQWQITKLRIRWVIVGCKVRMAYNIGCEWVFRQSQGKCGCYCCVIVITAMTWGLGVGLRGSDTVPVNLLDVSSSFARDGSHSASPKYRASSIILP